MTTETSWRPLVQSFDQNDNGKLDPRERRALPDSAFALPELRELPLVDAEHVIEAVSRIAELRWISPADRARAVANISAAAAHFGIVLRWE